MAPTHSPESQFLLTLMASQVPTPNCSILTLPDPVVPQVWDSSTPGIATHNQPVLVCPKDPFSFPVRSQFPISETHCQGVKPIITHLLSQGHLIPVDSSCNTPILTHKPSGAYHLVQDLCLINDAAIPVHPLVNNP